MTNVQAVLEPYRIYSPCHFSMIDGQDHCLTANDACVSDDFTISDTTDPERQVWSLKIWLSSSLSRLRPEAVVFMQASEKLLFGILDNVTACGSVGILSLPMWGLGPLAMRMLHTAE